MKIIFLVLKNLKAMIKQRDKYLFIVFLGLTVTVTGLLFYFGYFLHDYYSQRMSTECEIEIKKDSKSSDIYNLTEKLIELSDDIYSFCVLSSDSLIKFTDGVGLSVAGLYLDDWKDLLQGGKLYSCEETDSKLILPMFGIQELNITNNEPLIGHNFSTNTYDFEVVAVVDPFPEAKVAVPPLFFAKNFTTSNIRVIWKNSKSDLEKRGLSECLSNKIICSSKVKDCSNPINNSALRQIAQIELIAFGIMCVNVFVLVFFWLEKNKNRNYIYALCGASKLRVQMILFGITILPAASSIVAGTALFSLVFLLLRNYDILYKEAAKPYLPLLLMIFIVLCVFCIIVSKRATRNKIIYKAVE